MTYELAKQLKDAGFSYKSMVGHYIGLKGLVRLVPSGGLVGKAEVLMPDLPELIEACGEAFYCIYRRLHGVPNEERWVAETWEDWSSGRQQGYGKTPEEAVAKLWLALNKK